MRFFYKILLITIWLSLHSASAQNTIQEYISMEETRVSKVDSIMLLVENYILNNLTTYNLTQLEINDITNDLSNIHDGRTNPIVGNELDSILQNIKKYKLYNNYFSQNPNDTIFFKPTEIPSHLRQACINGGFELGLVGYTFRESHITPTSHFDNSECQTNDNLDNSFTPSNVLNNFTSMATLVSPGNEPYLQNLNITIDRVLTGNRAIKLNPSATVPNNQTGNRVSMSRSFNINENLIEFSFLYYGHTTAANSNNSHADPFFRYRLIDDTGTVLSSNCYSVRNDDCRFNVVADPTLGNPVNDQISYTPNWICERIDTSQWLGQNVTLEFFVSDCQYRGHFSTVYIDNICGVSCTPTFGDISIDPININCPNSNFNVCGNFDLPEGTSLTSLSLTIIDDNNNIFNTLSNPSIIGNNYCFNIDPSIFGTSPIGNYSFTITLDNSSNCIEFDQLTIDGGLVSFNNCANPCSDDLNSNVTPTELVWDDIATSYDIEFVTDDACSRIGLPSGVETSISYLDYQSNTIDLNTVWDDLEEINPNFKAMRYRIKTNCGDWSDWCCIRPSDTSNPNLILFENPYDECFPDNPCEDFSPITLTSPNDNVNSNSGDIDYIDFESITASNKIESGFTSEYRASDFIRLIPNFHAKHGSSFKASIQECVDIDIVNPTSSRKMNTKTQILKELKIYPNPAKEVIHLSHNNLYIQSFTLYDIHGRIVNQIQAINTNKHSINVSNLENGMYILSVVLEDDSVVNRNVIIK